MVILILAFMAFQAVCATQEMMPVDAWRMSLSKNLTCQWSQPFAELYSRKRNFVVEIDGGLSCFVSSLTDRREIVQIYKGSTQSPDNDVDPARRYMLGCYLPHLQHRMSGDIFSLFMKAPELDCVYGSVGYQNEDAKTGCLLVRQPYEDAKTIRFSLVGSELVTTFCVYDFQSEHLSVTRFLVKYADQSQFFVRMQIPYASIQKILVTWGGSANGIDTWRAQPLLFDLTLR